MSAIGSVRSLGKFAAVAGLALLVGGSASAFDWRANFIDPEDGRFDVSEFLSRGGFVPVPVIITEPAVDGGFGIIGQFVSPSKEPGIPPSRTIAGGAVTGNGSRAGGLMHSGTVGENRYLYRAGLGAADMTLPIYPFGLNTEIDYGNISKFAFANIRYRVPDSPFSLGPRFIYRTSEVSLKAQGELGERLNDVLQQFSSERQYASVGFTVNFDTRNNPISPTEGTNAILLYDFYSDAIGSDKEFGHGQLAVHSFGQMWPAWSLGAMMNLETVTNDAPFFMAPVVGLRGVERGRYQGETALTVEAEVRNQFTPRWAAVAFGGYGETYAGDSRIYESQDDIWTYGAGVRYRIARKLGIDVGLDVARGPESTIFYIQFGHAWSRSMD